ncbi:MAG TPA: hypothetical protein PLU22_07580, partial [Polyangiaceae bacterium]|nr:hypothetical protein [Polyangiaceae bacterium]
MALVPAAIGADGRSILLCTLGASWAVVVEAFAFLAPSVVDLYAQHPERAALEAERREHALREPDEVWVLSTSNAVVAAKDAAPGSELWEWWRGIDRRPVLRVWVASDVGALASPRECASMTELTLRVALLGAERARGGQLVMSLAGGRKTMSADLQRAALTFGCQGLVHVVGTEPLPPELRNPAPTLLRGPLPAALAGALRPVVVGRAGRSELLDLATADRPAVTSERYPISLADPCDAEVLRYSDWRLVDGPSGGLLGELERRELEAHALLGNFLASVQLAEAHENWRSLYRLPPARIEELRRTRLGPEHAAWLERLPRAELHCHLGGLLDRAAQREVARAVWDTATNAERSR